MKASALYIQICVPAPEDGLSGTVVADLIEQILSKLPLPWVAATDIDVAGDVRPQLSMTAREIQMMPTRTLLPLIRRARQVIWASLFFCRTEADARKITPDETYESSAEKATVTVRMVDASYIYVLGEERVLRDVEEALPPGQIRKGSIQEMEFPE